MGKTVASGKENVPPPGTAGASSSRKARGSNLPHVVQLLKHGELLNYRVSPGNDQPCSVVINGKGKVLLKCLCCNASFTPSSLEAHHNKSGRRHPYQYLFTHDNKRVATLIDELKGRDRRRPLAPAQSASSADRSASQPDEDDDAEMSEAAVAAPGPAPPVYSADDAEVARPSSVPASPIVRPATAPASPATAPASPATSASASPASSLAPTVALAPAAVPRARRADAAVSVRQTVDFTEGAVYRYGGACVTVREMGALDALLESHDIRYFATHLVLRVTAAHLTLRQMRLLTNLAPTLRALEVPLEVNLRNMPFQVFDCLSVLTELELLQLSLQRRPGGGISLSELDCLAKLHKLRELRLTLRLTDTEAFYVDVSAYLLPRMPALKKLDVHYLPAVLFA